MDRMQYCIEKDKKNVEIKEIMAILKQTYWANNRTEDIVKKSVENSLCYYVFDTDTKKLIGFARVITDWATTYYLCDVIVDEKHRGKGIGKMMMQTITADDALKHLRGLLVTRDAHGLYESYGFFRDTERCMQHNPE